MRLSNEFTVPAPVERVWLALLDLARVAECLPGATLEPDSGDGVFRGLLKFKVGPVVTVYQGIARLQDVDDDTHTASIALSAKEAQGQGTATAVIVNRLDGANGSTRVVVDTDVAITGRQAQFGRGAMQDVATRLMGEFASDFQERLREGDAAVDTTGPAAESADQWPGAQSLATSTPVRIALGTALGLLVVILARRFRP